MSNDLEVIEGTLPAVPLRDPKEILEEAGDRAKALKEMVQRTNTSKRIGNKEHLQIEAWATIGNFYGCTAKADDSDPVTIEGVAGAKARARVVHVASGRVVSEAVSYCLRDEENWKQKPFFQLSSMAQTRACSKALANAFRWVVVMAGYATTPAEEMTGHEYDKPKAVIPQSRPKQDATMVLREDKDLVWMPPAPTIPLEPPQMPQDVTSQAPAVPFPPSAAEYCRQKADAMSNSPIFTFGKHKGQTPYDEKVPDDYLAWIEPMLAKQVNDPGKARYQAVNQALLDAVRAAMIDRNAMPLGE